MSECICKQNLPDVALPFLQVSIASTQSAECLAFGYFARSLLLGPHKHTAKAGPQKLENLLIKFHQ
jgi:hypothetical protein